MLVSNECSFVEIEHVAEANVQVNHQRREMSEHMRKQVYQALFDKAPFELHQALSL